MKIMRTIFLSIFISWFHISAVAQVKLTIVYAVSRPTYDSTKPAVKQLPVTLVINDSLTFSYYDSIPHLGKISTPLGSSYWPKSTYINMNTARRITSYTRKKSIKKIILVNDSCDPGVWEIFDATKEIMGYKCVMARGNLNGQWIQGWFARDLPVSCMPFNTTGLPGVLLEYYYEKSMFISTAVKIRRDAAVIVEPRYAKSKARTEWNRR